jgi:hypothetical protein
MKDDLKEIKKKVEKLIEKLDNNSIYGVIPYLETILEEIEAAEKELKEYEMVE